MKNNYRIDIILPVYNSKDFIISTLVSVTKQTYKNWRLLIVDDNSDDGTRELIIGFIKNWKEKKKNYFS
jgi:glycosyltransferase involved in cell wall biosynthesis